MRLPIMLFVFLLSGLVGAQETFITGVFVDTEGLPASYANAVLFHAGDSSLVKAEVADDAGRFEISGIPAGRYIFSGSYLGVPDIWVNAFEVGAGSSVDLGRLSFGSAVQELAEATVTASRSIVEVKADRTVFNVEGTINSAGTDGLSLLRKAPGVTVDNNDNINVLGRSGVLIYVNGKRLPLSGQELTIYLENLPAEQIDRIDIISNPGSRYEAEGNAGIIDIQLKKDTNLGSNGSVNGTWSRGRLSRYNGGMSGNYRDKRINLFGTVGGVNRDSYHEMVFLSYQNGLILDEINNDDNTSQNLNYRAGMDFYAGKHHTIGFLVSGQHTERESRSFNYIKISPFSLSPAIDSILVARTFSDVTNRQQTYNLNYRFASGSGTVLNVDLDYGKYDNAAGRILENNYFDSTESVLLSGRNYSFDTPTLIEISTFTADYEQSLWGGQLGLGTKLSRVATDNTFLRYNVLANQEEVRDDSLSNQFDYDEQVFAGYVNYARSLGNGVSVTGGLRVEKTLATGDLQAFINGYAATPVEFDYFSFFPSLGISWKASDREYFSLNYGRRINRPDYNVLNPFSNLLSELSLEKGNPFLRPEIVNNIELGYTYNSMYNFKLAYSLTTDQITRLISPDDRDARAGFISWDNLAKQYIWSFNASAPVQVSAVWNAYFNLSASHINNQADYGGDAIVDVQVFTYTIYQQHTFNLPVGLKGEIGGYFSGPGVWGGVFKYESNWSLDIGLQRKFMNNRLNARLAVSDIFYQTGWDGTGDYNNLLSTGSGRWDSRRFTASFNYVFGNEEVKSRKRKTGIEAEANRVGE